MEQELSFIQYQLWAVIALFLILIATNVVCYFVRKSEKNDEPQFGDMWDKGDIDKLIISTSEHLLSYPNHSGALYFGAKALIAKNENIPEAIKRLNRLREYEPGFRDAVQVLLDEVTQNKSS